MRCLKDRPPAADLFGVKGRAWLNDQQLPACERETVDAGLRQVDFLDTEIAQVDQLIAADALGWPEVKRLMSVPGVNVIVAATFMAARARPRPSPLRRARLFLVEDLPRVLDGRERIHHGVVELAVTALDLPDIDVLDDVAGFGIDRDAAVSTTVGVFVSLMTEAAAMASGVR